MASNDNDESRPRKRSSKRQPITLLPPKYVPMTDSERHQAVHAVAALISVARGRAAARIEAQPQSEQEPTNQAES